MAKKRKHRRAAPGRAARTPRVKASTRRAIIHAYLSKRARKAARTRKREGKKPKRPVAPVEAAAVDEMVLFEASEGDAPPAFVAWTEFHPPVAGRWRVTVELRAHGVVTETVTLDVPEVAGGFDWDAGPVPVQVRNVIRAWYETYRSEHPDSESPQAGMLRIAVVR